MMTPGPFHMMAKPIGPLCNLRCDYCYYLSKEGMFDSKSRSGFTMSDQVLEAFVKQYIEAQPEGTAEVNFSWQGGEPALLPPSFFEKALGFQRKYARSGMRIANSLQTNGTLIDRERAEWLAGNGFLVGVSIDGPEDLHDRYRRDPAGKGSFGAVMEGIGNLKAAGAEFNTLTVVQADNADHPKRVYDFLKSLGSRFLQFIPIVESTGNGPAGRDARWKTDDYGPAGVGSGAGGAESADDAGTGGRTAGAVAEPAGNRGPSRLVSDRSVRPDQWGAFMNGVFDRWVRADVGRVFVQHFDMLLGLHAGYPPSMCVHAETCGTAMAVEHDGGVYSCDHFVFPEFRLGNLAEEPLEEIVARPLRAEFGAAKRDSLPGKCLSCRYLNLCRGACPKDRLIEAPGGMLNWLCDGYYALYEHTEPHFRAMASALGARMPASEYRRFFRVAESARPGRNDPCPCGSGRKFKSCHGRLPSV